MLLLKIASKQSLRRERSVPRNILGLIFHTWKQNMRFPLWLNVAASYCLHAGFPFIWIKWLRRLLLLSCLDRLRSCVKLIEGAAKKLLLVSQLPFSLFHFQRVPDHFSENSLPLPARHNWEGTHRETTFLICSTPSQIFLGLENRLKFVGNDFF